MKPLIGILFLIPLFVFANRNETDSLGAISGTVFTSDGQPCAYVTVSIKNTSIGTTTDVTGTFEFKKINTGNYSLSVSLSGYNTIEIPVEIKLNETTTLKIQLQLTYKELLKVIVKADQGSKYVEIKLSSSLRLDYPLIETPQNIHTTSRQLLSDQGLISMSEAIRTVSGIQKDYGGLNDISLNIRGFEATWNVLRNGLGGYWWNQQEDIAMIEKIEFIKGPAGFIVNDLHPGGIVNIVTKQPIREHIATINVTAGSYYSHRVSGDIGGAFSKKSNLSYRFNTGFQQQNRSFKFSNASRFFICGALKYDPDKKNIITAEYNYMWGKTSGNNDNLPSINGKMFSLPRKFAVADAKTDNLIVADNYYRLEAKHKFNENWNLTFLLGYMSGKWGQGYQLTADGNTPVTNDSLYRLASFDDWRNYSKVAQAFINGTFHTGHAIEHKILTALDYHNFGVTDVWGEGKYFGLYIPHPDYYIHPDSLRSFSIDNNDTFRLKKISFFAEDHIKIKEKLIFTLAGRFTHEDIKYSTTDTTDIPVYQHNTSYNNFTPRFGLMWLFSHDVSAYVLYDRYFLPLHAKNSERKQFKPVTGYNAEAGFKSYFFEKQLSTSLSFYHIVVNNTLFPDPLHPGFSIQAGQVISNGIEFDVTGNITPAIMINANYSFSDETITKGDSSMQGRKNIGTPDHHCNLWINYKLISGNLKGVTFSFGYEYMGKRGALSYDDAGSGNYYLPVYNLLNAALSYRNEKFSIALNLYNVANISYATIGSFNYSNNEWRYTQGEPVNFRLSFGVNLLKIKKNVKINNG